ncbi:G-box-binding factor 1-like isoform X1 [Dendrobium catenatum]|uniref:G-box-binding factor 1 n=1 Tax=Dendrobium catenatum TaxID=906689 RepID=A0A2I0WYD1_9ASPA|nr:G-box-binding factor 1-like isoform X1 [Dendrobium catenatum]PKU80670.1 G-box-binding factor 1 [Dendrobium catenatum]
MGSPGETSTPAKPPNSTPFTAATTPPPAYTAEWAASLQAYYSGNAAAPTAFFPPVWGGQHIMSPYATPIAYSPMYAPGAVYAHPSMTPGMGYPNADSGNIKSKGALLKFGEGGKAGSGSGEEENSQRSSGGSATEGSSDTGNESADPQENSKKRSSGDAFQEGEASHPAIATPRKRAPKLPVSAPGRTALPGPATNLNIGMDIWNPPHTGPAPLKVRPNATIASAAGANVLMVENQWAQDDRELKRERRKQSNRESARRSRLRKQQECDELARKVSELNSQNSALRMELEQLHKVCRDLEAENQHIADELSSIREESSSTLKQGVGDHIDTIPLSSTTTSTKMNGKLYHPGGNPDPSSR